MLVNAITQPYHNSTISLIEEVALRRDTTHIDISVAYITSGGARDLIHSLSESMREVWTQIPKRWITSFDYCRTDPTALSAISALPLSEVKIHDAARVLSQNCIPVRPYHPKVFIFKNKLGASIIAGSGNASRSGLKLGVEGGFCVDLYCKGKGTSSIDKNVADQFNNWFTENWGRASLLDDGLLATYSLEYNSEKNLSKPTPTDDDIISVTHNQRAGLTTDDLIKLRSCSNLWIQSGNITRNLGKHRPGNQLMLRRLSRVFFGVPASNLPQNSHLTRISVTYNHFTKDDCSMTFSDNGMDKLTLPVPGAGGPTAYDTETLLFTRRGLDQFDLKIGTKRETLQWMRNSRKIKASYVMPSGGRTFGVF